MNNNVHIITDPFQLEYVRDAIEYLDYELGRRQRRLAFSCPDYTDVQEVLTHLRELIADFGVNCIAATNGSEGEDDE
nr:MAG TPA: hypothetical protein [Bacteriophage sp.]